MDLLRRRYVKTSLLILLYFAMGLFAEMTGPTLTDLKLVYRTNYESLSRAITGRSLGGVFGALLGGPLVDKFENKADICLCILTSMSAMATVYVPLAADVESTWYGHFVLGLSVCTINIVNTRIILSTWKERSSTVLQFMLTVYGIGALSMPLICSPFLINTEKLQSRNDDVITSMVHVPYIIVAVYLCVISVLFFTSYIFSRHKTNNVHSHNSTMESVTWTQYINPATYANGNMRHGSTVLILMFIYYLNYAGCEKIFANFVRTISIDMFDLSKTDASYINTIFWSSFTLGRILTIVLTRYVTTRVLVLLDTFLHFASVCLMINYATTSIEAFRICTFIEGLLMAPLFGLVIAYVNTLIEVKGACLTVTIIAGSLGQWIYMGWSGTLYDHSGPVPVLTLLVTPAMGMVIVSVLLVTIRTPR